jgi:hypothetical protein
MKPPEYCTILALAGISKPGSENLVHDLPRQLQTAIKVRIETMNPPHPVWTAVGTTACITRWIEGNQGHRAHE